PMRRALEEVFGDRLVFRRFPSEEELRVADVVIQSVGRIDSEGWDQPFDLPAAEEAKVRRAVALNPHTIVVINAGSGINMTAWHEGAAAILYAWYPGQVGNRALAEILAGRVNPSGKLPCTIERRFEDSPAYGYMPGSGRFYRDWSVDSDFSQPVYDVRYAEGILMGYRWYDAKGFSPLFAFGHGLSYTTFAYDELEVEVREGEGEPLVDVSFAVRNTTWVPGAEVTQLYVGDERSSVLRPIRELKRFRRVSLEPYAEERVEFTLRPRDLAFWDPRNRSWRWEPGFFTLSIGGASDRLPLQARFELRA
ncbi:MAG: glycoside hydrolase family 3 C-terminal domain-containing protein, partial [Opitutales bacterium]